MLKNGQSSWFLSFHTGKICTTLYFSVFGAKSLVWLVIGASTLKSQTRGGVINTYYSIHLSHLGYWSRFEPTTTIYKFRGFQNLPFWAVDINDINDINDLRLASCPNTEATSTNFLRNATDVSTENDKLSTYYEDLGLSRQLSCLRGRWRVFFPASVPKPYRDRNRGNCTQELLFLTRRPQSHQHLQALYIKQF